MRRMILFFQILASQLCNGRRLSCRFRIRQLDFLENSVSASMRPFRQGLMKFALPGDTGSRTRAYFYSDLGGQSVSVRCQSRSTGSYRVADGGNL